MRGRPPRGGRPRCIWLMGNRCAGCRLQLHRRARCLVAVPRAKSFRLPAAAELLSLCVAKEKVTKEKGHPAWRLPGIVPGKSVSRGRAFRQHIPVLAKRNRHRADSPCGAYRPRLTAAQGPPGRAACHPGPHSVRNRCAVARAEEPTSRTLMLELAVFFMQRTQHSSCVL